MPVRVEIADGMTIRRRALRLALHSTLPIGPKFLSTSRWFRTFAHPFQPIRQVEQFLLDFRDPGLSC
jgi:hypothetical protein